jgi:hypothetical protein
MTSLTDVNIASGTFKANVSLTGQTRWTLPANQTGTWHSAWECITV